MGNGLNDQLAALANVAVRNWPITLLGAGALFLLLRYRRNWLFTGVDLWLLSRPFRTQSLPAT